MVLIQKAVDKTPRGKNEFTTKSNEKKAQKCYWSAAASKINTNTAVHFLTMVKNPVETTQNKYIIISCDLKCWK